MQLKEITENREEFFRNHYPFDKTPKLTARMYCPSCKQVIALKDFKVMISSGELYIVCPNAPKCSSDPTDWMSLKDGARFRRGV